MDKNRILSLVLIIGLLLTPVFMGGCYLVPGGGAGEGEGEGIGGMAPLIIFLVLIFGLMYFTMIRPQRKKQQEHQELMAELHRGDRVITAGGIYGTIESITEENVVLKVESGTTIRVLRSSIINKRER